VIRHATCKCGRLILVNDDEKKVSHEAPECDWFKGLLAEAGPHSAEVEVLNLVTGRKLEQLP
jgi:hypothetical protein